MSIKKIETEDECVAGRLAAAGIKKPCSSNIFLQKSRKLRPSGGYIFKKKLVKMLISTTYSKIIEIGETPPLLF